MSQIVIRLPQVTLEQGYTEQDWRDALGVAYARVVDLVGDGDIRPAEYQGDGHEEWRVFAHDDPISAYVPIRIRGVQNATDGVQ